MSDHDIRAITFDCYGTLVDWESGIIAWAEKLIARKDAADKVTPEDFLHRWEEHQFALLTPYRGYRDLAARAVERVLRDLKLPVDPDDGPSLGDSFKSFRTFPDTPDALRRLHAKYKVNVISNMDNVVLFETVARLGAPVHNRFSAEDARAYKPDRAPFELALSRLGLDAQNVLHVAMNWRYDLQTATDLGFQTAFVARRGAKQPEGKQANFAVATVGELADKLLASG